MIIREALASVNGTAAQRLTQLQQALHCGTSCGSCLPALRGLVDAMQPAPPVPLVAPT